MNWLLSLNLSPALKFPALSARVLLHNLQIPEKKTNRRIASASWFWISQPSYNWVDLRQYECIAHLLAHASVLYPREKKSLKLYLFKIGCIPFQKKSPLRWWAMVILLVFTLRHPWSFKQAWMMADHWRLMFLVIHPQSPICNSCLNNLFDYLKQGKQDVYWLSCWLAPNIAYDWRENKARC